MGLTVASMLCCMSLRLYEDIMLAYEYPHCLSDLIQWTEGYVVSGRRRTIVRRSELKLPSV